MVNGAEHGGSSPKDWMTPALPKQLLLGVSASPKRKLTNSTELRRSARLQDQPGGSTAKKGAGRRSKPDEMRSLPATVEAPRHKGVRQERKHVLPDEESEDEVVDVKEDDSDSGGEAEWIARLSGGEAAVGISEEALDVVISILPIKVIMPDLGRDEDVHCRTINAVIKWKEETMSAEFARLRKNVPKGGESLREEIMVMMVANVTTN